MSTTRSEKMRIWQVSGVENTVRVRPARKATNALEVRYTEQTGKATVARFCTSYQLPAAKRTQPLLYQSESV